MVCPSTACVTNSANARTKEPDLNTLQMRVAAEISRNARPPVDVGPGCTSVQPRRTSVERVLGALVNRRVLATDGRAFARADAGARYA
jgi:hypothetical protein